MTAQSKFRAIRTVCWVGVAADALWFAALVYPQFYGILIGRPQFHPDLPSRLAMGVGASMMLGWTLLLAWTARNPIERRAVMLLTALPVLAGLSIVTIIGYYNGNATNIWILVKCAFLTIAMLTGYHMANTIAKECADENYH